MSFFTDPRHLRTVIDELRRMQDEGIPPRQQTVIDGIRMLQDAGVDVRHRCNFYVYMHNDQDYDSALERCNILRGLGALPYIMVNRQAKRTQRMSDLKRWTRPQIFFSTEYEGYSLAFKQTFQNFSKPRRV